MSVRARNDAGWSGWSGWTSAVTLASVPGKPRFDEIEAGKGYLALKFGALGGGEGITGYTVQYKESAAADAAATTPNDPSTGWVEVDRGTEADPPTNAQRISGLTDGTGYDVRVRATNANGDGPWSDIAQGTPNVRPPAKPAEPGVTVTGSPAELAVSWTAPDDRGSPITAYQVAYGLPGGMVAQHVDLTGTTTTTTITGLQPGTTYRVNLRARNAAGWSEWSYGTVFDLPPAVPAKPDVTVALRDRGLDVSWTLPYTGGRAITGYTVQYKESAAADAAATTPNDPSTGWVAVDRGTETDPPTASHTISGLTGGTAYRVRVRATNDLGDGDWSDAVSGTPVPKAPILTNQDRCDGGQTGKFWAVANTDYLNYCDGQNWKTVVTANAKGRCTESRPLFRGSTRVLRHCGSDANDGTPIKGIATEAASGTAADTCSAATFGDMQWRSADRRDKVYYCNGSAWTAISVQTGRPDFSPSFSGATVADRIYTVGTEIEPLVLPAAEGGDGTLSYTLATLPAGLAFDAATRTLSGTPEASGTSTMTYTATDADDSSPDTDTLEFGIEVRTPPPAAPADLEVSPDSELLNVGWTAPSGTLTGYDVHYTAAAAADLADDADVGTAVATEWVAVSRGTEADPPAASQTITGLTNDTEYRVRVRAKNTAGAGAWAHAAGTPKARTWQVSPGDYTVPEGTEFNINVVLSVPAPDGGVTFTVNALFGAAAAVETNTANDLLCSENAKAAAADLGASPPATVTVGAGETAGELVYPTAGDDFAEGYECFAIQLAPDDTATAAGWTAAEGGRTAAQALIEDAAPPAPAVLKVTPGDGSLGLVWTAPVVSAGTTIAGYDVHYTAAAAADLADGAAVGSDAATEWVAVSRGTESDPPAASQAISGLSNDQAYRVRVRAAYAGGKGSWAHASGTPAAVTAPSVPRTVGATGGDDKILVTWEAPSSWGTWPGAAFQLDIQTVSGTGDPNWEGAAYITDPTATSYSLTKRLFTNLLYPDNGGVYNIRIRAESQQPGTDGSQDSHFRTSSWVTVSGVSPQAETAAPGAVGSLTATPGDTKYDLVWTAPPEEVTGYDVHATTATATAAPDSAAVLASGSVSDGWINQQYADTALKPQFTDTAVNGTPYRVRVRAVNSAGAGPWSFVTVTPAATATPTAQWARSGVTVRETDVDRRVTLDIVLSETLTDAVALSVSQTSGTATSSGTGADWEKLSDAACVTGSSGDTSLSCTLVVKGDDDVEGDETAELTLAVTSGTVAVGTRSAVTVTIENDDVAPAVVWRATLTPSELTGSIGCSGQAGCNAALSDNTFTVGGTEFSFKNILNSFITGSIQLNFSANVNEALKALEFCSGSVSVPLSDASGSALFIGGGYAMGWVADTPVEIRLGSDCAVAQPPSAPQITGISPGDGSLSVRWTAPSTGVVTGYELEWKAQSAPDAPATTADDPDTGWVSTTNEVTGAITFSGLDNGKTYDVRMRATSDVGPGAWATGTGTPQAAAPGVPTGPDVTAGDGTLAVSWTAPSGTVTGYDVHYTSAATTDVADGEDASGTDPSAAWVAVDRGTEADPPAASQTIPGLSPMEYRVRVRAKNAAGAGAWAHGTGTPRPADTTGPSAPAFDPGDGTTVTDAGTNITLTFAEAVRKDAADTDFTGHADLSAILTLARTDAGGTAIAYAASINAEMTVITIDPTDDLADGVVYVGISTGYYDVNGNAGPAASATFTVAATPAQSPDADLSALTASTSTSSGGTFTALDIGAFSAGTASYTVTVAHATTYVKLTPTANHASATVAVGRQGTTLATVASGATSAAIALDVGANALTVRVTAEDGTAKDYTVTVTREAQAPATVTLSASPDPVTEGDPVTVTATLSRALPRAVTIPLTIADDTAESADHGTLSGIRIAGGRTTGTGRIATRQDDDIEDETFTVALDAANLPSTVVAGATASVTVTIDDDDTPTVSLTVSPRKPVRAGESVTVTVALSAALPGAVTIPLTLTPGEGTTSADYGTLAGIRIAAGATSGTGTLATVADDDTEYESVIVALDTANLPAEVSRAPRWWARVTIAPRPVPIVWLEAPEWVDEGEAATVTARLTEALSPAAAVTIPVTARFNDGPAQPHEIAIAAGATSGTLDIATLYDDDSDHETLIVAIDTGLLPAVTPHVRVELYSSSERPREVVISVRDRPSLAAEGGSAREGRDEAVAFTVRLSYVAIGPVTVDWATADAAGAWQGAAPATAGADYTAASGRLTFARGETSKTVSVPIVDDAVDEGTEHFLLRLSNPRGAYLKTGETQGLITNDDHLQAMWLARFGRTVGSQVTDAVSGRLDAGLSPGAHATFAGQPLDLAHANDGRALAEAMTGLARAFGAPGAPAANEDPGSGAPGSGTGAGSFARHGLSGGWNDSTAASAPARSMTGRELLLGSAFHLATDGDGSAPGLAAWGRVAHGSFEGEHADDSGSTRVDGEVVTGVLGADADWGRVLAGVAVSLSEGEGAFDSPEVDRGSSGRIESTMTAVSPYARLKITERVSAWGLAGWGMGDMTIGFDDGSMAPIRTDIAMQMGAMGARGALLEQDASGGMDLALKADAFFVRMDSEKAANSAETEADASRVRLVLEGGRAFALSGTATLRPLLELGLRHDGGDAETGTGVEVGGGVSYADAASGLSVEARARMLIAHADSDYEEWGASATARLDPGSDGRGLSLSLSPTLGSASSATERLWGAHDAHGLAPGSEFEAARGLTAEAGYGIGLFGGAFTGTPNLGFGMSDGGARDYRIGLRLNSAAPDASGFEVSLDATRSEPANDNEAEHGVMLRSAIRW